MDRTKALEQFRWLGSQIENNSAHAKAWLAEGATDAERDALLAVRRDIRAASGLLSELLGTASWEDEP